MEIIFNAYIFNSEDSQKNEVGHMLYIFSRIRSELLDDNTNTTFLFI